MFYCLLLDTCPLNHIVTVLFHYMQISFVKYRRLGAVQVIAKDTDVKKDWGISKYVASFVTEIVFKAKLDSCTGE